MIKLDRLSKAWQEFRLQDISLDIIPHEYFVILGPTGAGKTLLLEMLAGFYRPDAGAVYINDVDISVMPPEKRDIGFVYQDYMLFPHMDVFDNIAYGLTIKKYLVTEGGKTPIRPPMRSKLGGFWRGGVSPHPQKLANVVSKFQGPGQRAKQVARRATNNERVHAIASTFGIAHLLHRGVETLSGGEQQRVALARALVLEPQVLLLDEPLNALDPQLQRALRTELKTLHSRFDMTTIHVTHEREEAVELGDRIAVMMNGKLLQVGTPSEIFQEPATPEVASFVGVENLFEGLATRDGDITIVDIYGVKVSAVAERTGDVNVSIRPENIIISRHRTKTSARNMLFGKVVEVKDRGTTIELKVDCGLVFMVFITRQSFMELEVNIGKKVYLYFKASCVHLF